MQEHDNFYGDGLSYWSPTINLAMDPRWGRNMEVPGEDPLLTGQYAAYFVQGLQGAQLGSEEMLHRPTVLGCCKHFIANNLENWGGISRHNVDVHVPSRDLADYYLPPFEACVKQGRSKGLMVRQKLPELLFPVSAPPCFASFRSHPRHACPDWPTHHSAHRSVPTTP